MTASENIAMFVGGPWDGRRRVVYDCVPYIYVREPVPIKLSALHFPDGCEPPAKNPALREIRYRRCVLRNAPHTALYVVDTIPYERVIDELVMGYRLPRERKDGAE